MARSILWLILLLTLAPVAARAQASATPPAASAAASAVTPAQAAQALSVLQNPEKRQQLIDTLETIAKVPLAPRSASTATTSPTPATSAAAKPAAAATAAKPAAKKAATLSPNSLGAVMVTQLSRWLHEVSQHAVATARSVTDFSLLWRWLVSAFTLPFERALLFDAAWHLGIVIGAALLLEWAVVWLLRRPMARLERSAPPPGTLVAVEPRVLPGDAPPVVAPRRMEVHFLRARRLLHQLPLVIARLFLELLPIAVFAGVALALLSFQFNSTTTTRMIILAVAYAYMICRAIMGGTRTLVSPSSARLRVFRMSDHAARYVEIWVRRMVIIAVSGSTIAEVAVLLGLSYSAHDALIRVVALVVDLCLIAVILQSRRAVAARIRPHRKTQGAWAAVRLRAAQVWPYVAIFVVVALWVGFALEVRNGVETVLIFCAETVGMLVASRLVAIAALGLIDRAFHVSPELAKRFPGLDQRANRYFPVMRGVVSAVIWVGAILLLLELWGVHALFWFSAGRIGARVVSAALTILIAAAVAIVVWETANAGMDRHLMDLAQDSQSVRSARLRTLLPLLRTVLLVVILGVVALTILSQIGVNIAPLLAGAGIIGIAVGFGSQKLVQDVITGLFLLLENAMQVGDRITVSGLTGTVENLSIRNVWLRDHDGTVYIIPFSSVTSVSNTSRGIGNAMIAVSVAITEDTDRVGATLKEIADGMRSDEHFQALIIGDFKLWGVDAVAAAAVLIKGEIFCTAAGRWEVQREFNRRMKIKFEELGIKLA